MQVYSITIVFFFFNDTATTEIYTLSYTTLFRSGSALLRRHRLHLVHRLREALVEERQGIRVGLLDQVRDLDRKSTRLNSSHANISYAVFCLKKKKTMHLHSKITHI